MFAAYKKERLPMQATNDSIKLCECGCGQPAPIAKYSSKVNGQVKGQPVRFISGHNVRKPEPIIEEDVPPRYCECGCGGITPVAKENNVTNGYVRGQRMRFMRGHHPQPTVREKFDTIAIPGNADECWEWTGRLNNMGYGVVRYGNKQFFAHRLSYEYHRGPIPNDLHVCHKCDNPKCWNPDHLFVGTRQDNMGDMVKKGRTNSKLIGNEVPLIRGLAGEGLSQVRIATLLGVTKGIIWSALHGKTWKHVWGE